jgi:hypothetical protein
VEEVEALVVSEQMLWLRLVEMVGLAYPLL